jgi:predicted sulfurtransferase
MKSYKPLLVVVLLLFTVYACTASSSQQDAASSINIPRTEADVPRISVSEAKAAFDAGQAVIADVRSAQSFAANRVDGAISIPLQNFEGSSIINLSLQKDQWIITYCT